MTEKVPPRRLVSVLVLLLVACSSLPSPTPAPTPTQRPTREAQPSATPAPTVTLVQLPTVVVSAATATPTELAPSITAIPSRTTTAVPAATLTPTPFPTLPPAPPFVRGLVAVPGKAGQLLAWTSDNRLARSDNGGMSWTDLPIASIGFTAITGAGLDYRNPKTLYLTGDKGIYRSDDQGLSWTLVNTMVAQGISVDFSDSKILWTGALRGRDVTIQRSSDTGQTWSAASTGFYGYVLAGPILLEPQDSNTLYAVADGVRGGQFIYRGTRDGAWKPLPNPGAPGPTGFVSIGLAWSSNSNTLYAGSFGGKLYGSTNAKEPDTAEVKWKVIADFGLQTVVSVLARGEPAETLYVSVFDTVGYQARLLKSADGGFGWQELVLP